MRAATLCLALAAAGAAGCKFAYRNPAEVLGPGVVGGRTVAGATILLDGVAVSLKGAGLDGVSRKNGHFIMLPLPVGRHTLVFRKGSERSLQRDVEIGWGKDGQPEGVWMGDVEIPLSVGITGSCAIPGGIALAGNSVAIDEASGTIVPVSAGAVGKFGLGGLALGEHRIRVYATDSAGRQYLGGPTTVTFGPGDGGTRKTLTQIALHPAASGAAGNASVTFRLAVVGDVPGLQLSAVQIGGLPTPLALQPNGLAQAVLPEGLWTIQVSLPPGVNGASPPPLVTFAAVAGETVDLGTLYVAAAAAQQATLLFCSSDSDCAPGTCGSGGLCTGWTPPPQAPAALPFCSRDDLGCTAGAPIGTAQPATMTCAAVPSSALTVGVACGSCCTPDGVSTVCGLPGQGGCPALPAPAGTFTISGTVSGAVSAGVTIVLGGAAIATTVTDATGAYSFGGLAAGSYSIIPSLTGYSFSPAARSVTISGDTVGQDFTAAALTGSFTISGKVSGAVAAGVTVQLTGSVAATTVTDSAGAYSFGGLPAGTYAIVPAHTGYTFSPPIIAVTLTGDLAGQDFVASVATASFTISGAIRGPSPSGVQVWILGPGADTGMTTDATGAYSFTGLVPGTYNVQPTLAGYTFVPASLDVTVTDASVAGQDFTEFAAGTTFGISGAVRDVAGGPVAGAAIQLTGTASLATATSADGTYAFSGVPPGTYAVTPSLLGFAFAPASASVVLTADASGVDFVASAAVPPSGPCTPDLWCWDFPLPQLSNPLGAVWGSSAGDVWAVGGYGTILHWNGAAWSASLAGAAYLTAVWGSSPSDVWAVGNAGSVLHWNGLAWSSVASGTSADLRGVWGSSPGDVWAVGNGTAAGAILHWDGLAWTTVGGAFPFLSGIGGTSAADVWAVGNSPAGGAAILHWDGSSWSSVAAGSAISLSAVWARSSADAWAAGAGATGLSTMLHWDGTAWSSVSSGTTAPLSSVWGSSASDAWAAGQYGTLVHWDGNAWSMVASGTGLALAGLWGSASADFWAVGAYGTVLHWSGSAWSGAGVPPEILLGVWGSSASDLWAVGALGDVYHRGATGWSLAAATGVPLAGLWGSSATDLWAVGGAVDVVADVVLHFDGASWTSIPTGTGAILYAVWGSSASDVWAVGDVGTIAHWNGTAWSAVPSGVTSPLRGISGTSASDVWAVGDQGTALHWDGNAWSGVPTGTPNPLVGVWGSSPADAWAVGIGGDVLHWDGIAWAPFPAQPTAGINAIHGASATDVWAVGQAGEVLHWDGVGWTAKISGTGNSLQAVWASGGIAWAVGEGPTILGVLP